MSTPEPIRCTDGCGATVRDVSEAEAGAWSRLQITGRLRCPDCVRALDAINFAHQPPHAGKTEGGEKP